MAVADREFVRTPFDRLATAVQHQHAVNQRPGFAAVATRVHRQRTAESAGNAGQELGAHQIEAGCETGYLGAGDAGLDIQRAVRLLSQRVQRAVAENESAVETAIAHQQVAAQPDAEQWFVGTQATEEFREIGEIRREVGAGRRPAGPPRHVTGHGFVFHQPSAQIKHGKSAVAARRRWNRRPW